MQPDYVGMFWFVNGELWLKTISLDELRKEMKFKFTQRNVITYPDAHFKVWVNWCEEYGTSEKYKHFMYYPRGRISHFPKSNRYELVIDSCLIANAPLVDGILSECGISRNNTNIVTQSDDKSKHYICHRCRPELFDDEGNIKVEGYT